MLAHCMEELRNGGRPSEGRRAAWERLRDHVETDIRETFAEPYFCSPDELEPEVVERMRRKLELFLTGDDPAQHAALLETVVVEAIQVGMDHAAFLRTQGAFAGRLAATLEQQLDGSEANPSSLVRALTTALFEEAAESMAYFFRVVDTQTWAERASLAQTFEADVVGSLGDVSAALDVVEHYVKQVRIGSASALEMGQEGASQAKVAVTWVEQVADATQQISGTAQELAQQVNAASQTANTAREGSERAGRTVDELAEQSIQIFEVVRLIRSIAEQTRMLALNASIEAARAGDAGRGFAVVADEVKTLAHDTAKATEHISQRVEAVQKSADHARAAMESVKEAIAGIDEVVHSIATVGDAQRSTTEQIAGQTESAASQVGALHEQVDEMSGFARDTASETGMVLEKVEAARGATQRLAGAMGAFMKDIGGPSPTPPPSTSARA